jgi:hypothetical protein
MINIKVHDLQGVDGTRIYKKIIKDVFVLKLHRIMKIQDVNRVSERRIKRKEIFVLKFVDVKGRIRFGPGIQWVS